MPTTIFDNLSFRAVRSRFAARTCEESAVKNADPSTAPPVRKRTVVLTRDDNKKKVSGAASPLSHKGENNLNLLSMPLRRRFCGGRKGDKMYPGTLIDDLMKTVERSEKRSVETRSQQEKLSHFYSVSQFELAQFEPSLAGVA